MTFSKQLFLYLFFFFLSPLLHALDPQHCSSSSCGRDDVHVHFPFWLLPKQPEYCGHVDFNLHCSITNKTSLKLPNSETLLVREIYYINQHIRLYDPENCLARKLFDFDISGSPFSALYFVNYTFLSCPNEVVKSSGFDSISCLGNSTTSFLATTSLDLAKSMLPYSCQIFKTLAIPVSRPVLAEKSRFSSDVNDQDLWLKWDSPSCSACERDRLRCGFIDNASLEVKCFSSENSGHHKTGLQVLKIITLSIIGPVMVFATCIAIGVCTSDRFSSRRRRNVAIVAQPSEVIVTTGLDESTIETYKKMELGESRRVPGNNDIVCSICLSEYVSKETVRCIPECDHCFHIDCIDVWLKIHGSCPLCRNSPSPVREAV